MSPGGLLPPALWAREKLAASAAMCVIAALITHLQESKDLSRAECYLQIHVWPHLGDSGFVREL